MEAEAKTNSFNDEIPSMQVFKESSDDKDRMILSYVNASPTSMCRPVYMRVDGTDSTVNWLSCSLWQDSLMQVA